MEKIVEQLISFETAKLAKEIRFNIYQNNQYSKGVNPTTIYNYSLEQCEFFRDTYYAPIQAILQKYIREKHNIHVFADCNQSGWYWILNKTNGTSISELDDYNYLSSYEEAIEIGLVKALNIIKNKLDLL
jgi:hypothetical protein